MASARVIRAAGRSSGPRAPRLGFGHFKASARAGATVRIVDGEMSLGEISPWPGRGAYSMMT